MSRRALLRKRCSSCGATVPDKVCPKGHRRWTWSFTVDVSPPGARRRQVTRSGYATKTEAQRALDEMKGASSRNGYVEPSRLALGSYFVERWLPAVAGGLRPSTFESYARNLRIHVLPALGDIRLQALQPSDLNRLYGSMLRSGRLNGSGVGFLSERCDTFIRSFGRPSRMPRGGT